MLVIGRNPVVEALRSEYTVNKIILEEYLHRDEKVTEVIETANAQNIALEHTSRKKLDKLSKKDVHQGIAAYVDWHARQLTELEDNANNSLVYIREAQYEYNLGAIIRTAEAAGLAGVIISPKQKITTTTARISMGGLFHLPIFQGSLFPTIKELRKLGYKIFALEINGGENVFGTDLQGKNLFIIGGEDKSISKEVVGKCDKLLYIPQFGKVNSLNMSVAAAIVIYDSIRQKQA